MGTQTIAREFADAFNAGDLEKVAEHLAPEFQFSGPVPQPIGAQEWLGMSAAMRIAFPDIQYNLRVEAVEGDTVRTSTQLSGTHTGDLDLTAMGLGVIPATGKRFSSPREYGETTVKGGRVISIRIETPPGGGLMGILRQLGVGPPSG
jgi:predicted ester cyclase